MKILRHEAGHADRQRLQAAAAAPPAAALRAVLHGVSQLLHAEAVQQELRAASRQLVRAEPSGRRLRRDLRGVAEPRVGLAHPLRRLAGAQEARVHGRADDRASPASRCSSRRAASSNRCIRCARPCAPTTTGSGATTASSTRTSTTAICGGCSRPPRSTRAISRRRASSRASGRTSAGWSRRGPASTSTRSTRCSRA